MSALFDRLVPTWRCAPAMVMSMALALSACGGGGASSGSASPAPTAQASGVAQSHVQIATLIYSDTQRTPAGFDTETAPVFNGYVATTHLKTTDLNSNATLHYELCSDDFNQALQWSETVNTNSSVNATLTGNDSTERYFEFQRLRNGTPQGYLRQRIYKCAYLSRNTVDLQASGGNAGMINARPLDAVLLKGLSEYLWRFTPYNNFGNVVLSSTGSAGSGSLVHTLTIATLVRASSGNCDTINVLQWQHTLLTASGDLSLNISTLFSFGAQESGGAVSLC